MARQGISFNLALEMAPPRIIATHRRRSSEMKLDTIVEENTVGASSESGSATAEFSDGTASPSVRHQRFGAELSRFAGFVVSDRRN